MTTSLPNSSVPEAVKMLKIIFRSRNEAEVSRGDCAHPESRIELFGIGEA